MIKIMIKLVFIILFLLSCNQNNSNQFLNKKVNLEIEEEIGEKVFFPKSVMKLLKEDKTSNLQTQNKFTIVAYYNGSCSACYLQLSRWIKTLENLKKTNLNVDFKFILSGDSNAVLKANLEEINFPLINAYHDKNDEFGMKYNFLLNESYTNSSMLLDKNDKILCIGNPIDSNGDMNKYIELMKD